MKITKFSQAAPLFRPWSEAYQALGEIQRAQGTPGPKGSFTEIQQ